MAGDLQALGRAIKQAQYRHHRALDSRLTTVGTTLAQWDALRAIDREPGSSARALAEETFQSEQAFGTLANRLASRGLIDRTPGHGRLIEHRLTPEGRRTLAAGNKIADNVLAESFADLSASERETLRALLQRVGAGSRA
ncbi:MarR family winged helix-turn-helix transcriptional regulator [Nocardia niigatensis]